MYADKLKYLREENNLTQEDVANIINISRGSYSLYELEYIIIPLKHLITLANYYDVSIDYIFNLSNIKGNNFNKNIDLITIGKRLKEFRKNNKLTQDKLAFKLNVARSIISKYEKGEFLISTHSLYTICSKFNTSADYLLNRKS